jgi:hypothetical protein
MANTYTFSMTAQQIAESVIRKTGAYDEDQAVPPDRLANALEALNVIAKDLAIEGPTLWCTEDVSFPGVVGQSQYNLSTIMGMPLPPQIMAAYIRTLNPDGTVPANGGNDVTLMVISRYDWILLGSKFQPGVPNQLWYDPQLTGGILTLYNVPNDGFHEIHVIVQRQIADVPSLTSTMDFPQEAARMLIWQLLDELALEYRLPPDERAEVNKKAVGFKERFFDAQWTQENASVFFTPSEKMAR